jgi:TatD DNase family protein
MNWIDSHSHLASLKYEDKIGFVIQEAADSGVDCFVQGGLDSIDWDQQISLKQAYPDKIQCVFGLHPYRASELTEEEIDMELDKLARRNPQSVAIGELGLDFRRHILDVEGFSREQVKEHQFYAFQNQLELAKDVFHKPVVLHVVSAHAEALLMLEQIGVPFRGGLLHSFSKNWDLAKKYLNFGLKISVGSAVTFPQNKDLRDCIKNINLGDLLLETDSPDQPIFETTGLNYPKNLIIIAQSVAQIKNIHYKSVLDICSENAKQLFKI